MLGMLDTALAIASVESATTWNWLLKIDNSGLLRWYLTAPSKQTFEAPRENLQRRPCAGSSKNHFKAN